MRGSIPAVRRLLQILLTAATAVSLVLCLATVVFRMRGTAWRLVSRPTIQVMVQDGGTFRYVSAPRLSDARNAL
jgi:hypothetical protein